MWRKEIISGRMDFAQAIRDTSGYIAILEKRLGWSSAKRKKNLCGNRRGVQRELDGELDFLAWLEVNAPQTRMHGNCAVRRDTPTPPSGSANGTLFEGGMDD